MSRHAKIMVLCVAAIGVAFVLRAFDGPYVIAAGIVGTAGIFGLIVEGYRDAQHGRPQPPWLTDDSDGE
jgi:hypothetical protein